MSYCICATTRPKSGMKRPSTPASFILRNTQSGSRESVRMRMNRRLATGLLRSLSSMRRTLARTSRSTSGENEA